jgi:hypothetical protein
MLGSCSETPHANKQPQERCQRTVHYVVAAPQLQEKGVDDCNQQQQVAAEAACTEWWGRHKQSNRDATG